MITTHLRPVFIRSGVKMCVYIAHDTWTLFYVDYVFQIFMRTVFQFVYKYSKLTIVLCNDRSARLCLCVIDEHHLVSLCNCRVQFEKQTNSSSVIWASPRITCNVQCEVEKTNKK